MVRPQLGVGSGGERPLNWGRDIRAWTAYIGAATRVNPCRQLGVQPYDPNEEHVCRELNHGLLVIRVGSRSTLYPEAASARSTEYGVIELAAVEDYRLLVDGLRAWIQTQPDLHLAAVTATVDGLLQAPSGEYDVVLLNPLLRADPDPAVNVRRLIDAGHRVLVIDGSADLGMVARSLAAGAHGYLTRDHDAAALARTLRVLVAGGTAWSPGPTRAPGAKGLGRPPLSEREHRLLMAYVSGLTLDSAARSLGISPETARTYLKRIKAKYHQVGRPAYTKLDLAQQVRADCTLGVSHLSQPQAE